MSPILYCFHAAFHNSARWRRWSTLHPESFPAPPFFHAFCITLNCNPDWLIEVNKCNGQFCGYFVSGSCQFPESSWMIPDFSDLLITARCHLTPSLPPQFFVFVSGNSPNLHSLTLNVEFLCQSKLAIWVFSLLCTNIHPRVPLFFLRHSILRFQDPRIKHRLSSPCWPDADPRFNRHPFFNCYARSNWHAPDPLCECLFSVLIPNSRTPVILFKFSIMQFHAPKQPFAPI